MKNKTFFCILFLSSVFITNSSAFSLDSLADSAINKINDKENNNDNELNSIKISNEKIKFDKNEKKDNETEKNQTQKKVNEKTNNNNNNSFLTKIKNIFNSKKTAPTKQTKKANNLNNNNSNNNELEIKINKNSAKKIVKNSKNLSQKEIKKIILKVYKIKQKIKKDLEKSDYNDLIQQLKKIQRLEYVKDELKENFYIYAFWKVLLKYANRKDLYLPKIKKESFEILSKILSFIDVNKDFNTKFVNNVYKLITYARMYNGDELIYLLNTYFPYGLNNEVIFYKLLKIANSDYIKNTTYIKIYKYLRKNFYNYFNNNTIINFQVVDEYFKLLIKFSYDEDFVKSGNQRILNNLLYQNSLNSNLYYYKALYYKYTEDYEKMKKYLLKAIEYNANNNKSWFELINYFFKERKKFIIKTLKFYKINKQTLDNLEYNKLPPEVKNTIIKYDNKIIQQIDYYLNNVKTVPKYLNKILLIKANLYFIEGTNFKLPDKLFKSANIYYSLKKCNLISNILNIITVINSDETKTYTNKIKKIYQKCINE